MGRGPGGLLSHPPGWPEPLRPRAGRGTKNTPDFRSQGLINSLPEVNCPSFRPLPPLLDADGCRTSSGLSPGPCSPPPHPVPRGPGPVPSRHPAPAAPLRLRGTWAPPGGRPAALRRCRPRPPRDRNPAGRDSRVSRGLPSLRKGNYLPKSRDEPAWASTREGPDPAEDPLESTGVTGWER